MFDNYILCIKKPNTSFRLYHVLTILYLDWWWERVSSKASHIAVNTINNILAQTTIAEKVSLGTSLGHLCHGL
jgi:hypothetical protein